MLLPYTYGSLCELVAANRIFDFKFEVYRNGELYGTFGSNEIAVGRLRFTQDLSNGHFDAYIPVQNEQEVCDQATNTVVIENTQSSCIARNTRNRRKRFLNSRRSSDQKRRKTNNPVNAHNETESAPSIPWKRKELSGINYNPDINYDQDKSIEIGAMIHKCNHCNALKWKDESPGMCCCSGKVQLPS